MSFPLAARHSMKALCPLKRSRSALLTFPSNMMMFLWLLHRNTGLGVGAPNRPNHTSCLYTLHGHTWRVALAGYLRNALTCARGQQQHGSPKRVTAKAGAGIILLSSTNLGWCAIREVMGFSMTKVAPRQSASRAKATVLSCEMLMWPLLVQQLRPGTQQAGQPYPEDNTNHAPDLATSRFPIRTHGTEGSPSGAQILRRVV